MSDIFPKWTNRLPVQLLAGAVIVGSTVVAGVWYYATPKYTRVGYTPRQPVAFSHSIHVDQVGLDCRYCHNGVEKSWYSNVPSAGTCMNCHAQILATDPKLALVRASAAGGKSIPWVQVHKLPDFVFFNHAVHVNRGVSCVHCHGEVNKMDEVRHDKPFSMSFCLDCHRNPAPNLRPLDKITDLNWRPGTGGVPADFGKKAMHDWKVQSLENCSACHR